MDSHLPKKICFICLIENPLKITKNAFYSILKALFILKIFKFLSRLFGHVGMTSQPGLEIIAIHILPNISQSKGKKTMKFGQFIKYSKINIFLQKLWRKWGKETSSRPLFIFLKKLNMRWKQVVCSLVSIYFDSPLPLLATK